jgi:hypothetical protein
VYKHDLLYFENLNIYLHTDKKKIVEKQTSTPLFLHLHLLNDICQFCILQFLLFVVNNFHITVARFPRSCRCSRDLIFPHWPWTIQRVFHLF